ncbi:MAG TPA: hypothetical protein QGF58_04575 [Myxococcota bacterium]|nr:hypothetical protein [Myxococcota bacterium]
MKTSGWLPVSDIEVQGDPALAEALAEALSQAGSWDRLTHGFHTYPAGMHPQCARILVELSQGPVHDPFCGGGTTLVEALAAGRRTSGADLSPVAVMVAAGRTALCSPERIRRFRGAGRRICEDAKRWQTLPRDSATRAHSTWYERHVAMELEGIRQGIRHAPAEVRDLLRLSLSSILVKVSHRRSDTSSKRDPRHRAPGTTAILFHKKVRELGRRLEGLASAVPEGTRAAVIDCADAKDHGPAEPVGALITSPPYPAVYDYLPLQRLRCAWLAMEPRLAAEMGSRRAFAADPKKAWHRWRQDLQTWMDRVPGQLGAGGTLSVVIGDGFAKGKVIDARLPLEEAARAAGLHLLARASGGRVDDGPGVIRREHILTLGR